MPTRPDRWPHIDRERLPLDEAVGQSILKHPRLRSAREHPEIAVPWIVLGLVTAGAYLYAGFPATLLVLLFGLPTLFGARLLARRRPDRPSRDAKPTDGFRLALRLRSAREHPEIVVPWIVLGLVTAGAYLYAGFPATLLVLLFGLPTLFGARLLARRRPDRPSRDAKPTDGFRLALMVGWVAAAFGVIAVIAWFEAATGSTGIVIAVVCFVALPILGKLLQVIFRV